MSENQTQYSILRQAVISKHINDVKQIIGTCIPNALMKLIVVSLSTSDEKAVSQHKKTTISPILILNVQCKRRESSLSWDKQI
jgi:hypothetical protein